MSERTQAGTTVKISDGHFTLPELSIPDLLLLRQMAMLVTAINVRNHLNAICDADDGRGALLALENLALQSRAQFDFHNEFYGVLKSVSESGRQHSSLVLTLNYREFVMGVVRAEATDLANNPAWAKAVRERLGITDDEYREAQKRLLVALEAATWTPPANPEPEPSVEDLITQRGTGSA